VLEWRSHLRRWPGDDATNSTVSLLKFRIVMWSCGATCPGSIMRCRLLTSFSFGQLFTVHKPDIRVSKLNHRSEAFNRSRYERCWCFIVERNPILLPETAP